MSAADTCPGFLPRTALVDCQTQNQLDATPPGTPVRQFLQNEIIITATGALQGYTETAAGGILTSPTVGGLRAAGFTPIANVLINIKQIFSGNFLRADPQRGGEHLQTWVRDAGLRLQRARRDLAGQSDAASAHVHDRRDGR